MGKGVQGGNKDGNFMLPPIIADNTEAMVKSFSGKHLIKNYQGTAQAVLFTVLRLSNYDKNILTYYIINAYTLYISLIMREKEAPP